MRTREIILEAAFRLFETHSFSELTVQDILNEAGVSRGTFYKYFKDKYEVQELFYLERAGIIFDRHHLPEHMDEAVWREMSTGVLRFIKEHRRFYLNAGPDRGGRDSLWNTIRMTMIELYQEIRKRHFQRETLTQEELVTIRCFVEGAIRMFQICVYEMPELSIGQMLDIAREYIPEDFRSYGAAESASE